MPRNRIPYIRIGFTVFAVIFLLFFSCNQVQEEPETVHELRAGCESLLIMAEKQAGSNTEVAFLYLDQARQMIDSALHPNDYALYHLIKGRVYYYLDDYASSIAHIDAAISIFRSTNSNALLAKAYSFLAPTQALLGIYHDAIQSSIESIQLYEQVNDRQALALAMNYLANLYMEQADFDKAHHYIMQAYDITLPDSLTLLHANVLNTMGKIQMAEEKFEEAARKLLKAYQIRLKCAEIRHIASSLYILSELAFLQKKYEVAIQYLEEAKQIYDQLEDNTGLFNVYVLSAEVYAAMHDMARAGIYADHAHEIAMSIDSHRHLARSSALLSDIHEKNNNLTGALYYFRQHYQYHNQNKSGEHAKYLASIEQYHELQQKTKDNEILSQKNTIRRQHNIIFLVVIIGLSILSLTLLTFFKLKNKNLKNKQHLLEKGKAIAEAKNQLHQKEKIMLRNNLELKNKELTSKTIELLHQVETMQSLAEKIQNLKHSGSRKEVEGILHELNRKTRENVWDEFHVAFNSVHNEFYERLLAICPDLSATEIKIAALLKLNLCTKEIAAISYKSESAVKTARHRLRQKLNLGPQENLINFLIKLS